MDRRPWFLLAGLAVLHGLIDLYGGFMPAILPAMRRHFGLSLTMGVVLLSVLNIATNVMQMTTGHLRADRHAPLFLWLAFILAACMALIPAVPQGGAAVGLLLAIAVVGGTGVAVFHPESMRAMHALETIPSSVGTPFFMMGGYFGFCGAALTAAAVERWGLGVLGWLAVPAAAGLAGTLAMRFKLAVEVPGAGAEQKPDAVSFRVLFWMAVPICTAHTFIVSLLPTHLNLLGYSLTYGGLASLLFGGGMGLGGVLWGCAFRHRDEFRTAVISLFISVPLMALYILLAGRPWSLVILAAAGLAVGGGYPMLVSRARSVAGRNLGSRMAYIIGGVWLWASIILMAAGPAADYCEAVYKRLDIFLHACWILYLGAAVFGLAVLGKQRLRMNTVDGCGEE
ncbi:MAG: hypothetical protein ABIF71_03160 [Planctomycetota bacterium]